MRTAFSKMFPVLLALVLVAAGNASPLMAAEPQKDVSRLPSSLDALYPPRADRPVFLFAMLRVETYFSGIVADLMENDVEGAQNSYKAFKSQYVELMKMVPEWKGYYPLAPVDRLAAELASGDRGRVMAAVGEVGRSCHECHLATMAQAQQRFHWGDFAAISIKDPLSQETAEYGLFKKYLSSNLAGMSVDLEQGQVDGARRQFEGFKARFQALGNSCDNCHDQQSRYFVDDDVQKLMDKLGRALDERQVDSKLVGSLLQGIGRESCSKCHLVHVPAAMARALQK